MAGRVDVVHLKDDAIEIETNARVLDLRARAVLAASIETAAEYCRLPNGQNVTEAQQMSQIGSMLSKKGLRSRTNSDSC